MMKITTVKKPARKARKGINPFTGEADHVQGQACQRCCQGAPLEENEGIRRFLSDVSCQLLAAGPGVLINFLRTSGAGFSRPSILPSCAWPVRPHGVKSAPQFLLSTRIDVGGSIPCRFMNISARAASKELEALQKISDDPLRTVPSAASRVEEESVRSGLPPEGWRLV